MQLTEQNYHSQAANQHYMSASQFKAFQDCEARAMAELTGAYQRETTTALLVGSYVDAHFSGTLNQFMQEHPEVFRQRGGGLKSEFEQANQIIQRIERDELFKKYISGQQQVIRIGQIAGVPFKIKMDSFHAGTAIVDLKIMRDMKPMYVPEQGRLSFIEAWRYDVQGAIYQAIEGNNLPFIIAAATKEKEPDLALIEVSQHYLDAALAEVTHYAPRYHQIKLGKIEPIRCEKCDYCRRTRRLTKIVTLDDFKDQDITSREDYEQ